MASILLDRYSDLANVVNNEYDNGLTTLEAMARLKFYLALRPHHCDRLSPASALPKTASSNSSSRVFTRHFFLCAWASRARVLSTRQSSSSSCRVCNWVDPTRLEEWDSKNHQIITWFRNTSTPGIHLQFGRFETAKE
ncbi:hypothetical protein PIB30_090238, partial [Stylosanthes scabra]|nr:hypothetical protein [Stylosanthes scabra]